MNSFSIIVGIKNISLSKEEKDYLKKFKRQALHAYKLEFDHPLTKLKIKLESKLPQDLQDLEKILENE